MFNKFLLFIFITLITISCYNLPDSSRKPIGASLEKETSFFQPLMDAYFTGTGKELILDSKELTKVFFDPYQQKAFIISQDNHSQWHMAAKDIHIAINGGENNRKDDVYFSDKKHDGPCCPPSGKPRVPEEVLFRNKGKNTVEVAIMDDIEFNYITYEVVEKDSFKQGQGFKGDNWEEYAIKRPLRDYGEIQFKEVKFGWDDLVSIERSFKEKEKRSWFKELFNPYRPTPIYDRVFILKIKDPNLYNKTFFVKLKMEEYDYKEKTYKIKYDFLMP